MFIKEITSRIRYDFNAVMECEHCGHQQGITTGYDDWNYHANVVPKMTCAACKKNRAGDVPAEPNEIGCGPYSKAHVVAKTTDRVTNELADLRAKCATLEAENKRLQIDSVDALMEWTEDPRSGWQQPKNLVAAFRRRFEPEVDDWR